MAPLITDKPEPVGTYALPAQDYTNNCGTLETTGYPGPGHQNSIAATYTVGDSIQVCWDVRIPHAPPSGTEPGVRIAIMYSNEDGFENNILATGIQVENAQGIQCETVTLPLKPCTKCTLQYNWVTEGAGSYLGCSNIKITSQEEIVDPNLICKDSVTNWSSKDEYTCQQYASNGWCTIDGQQGDSWNLAGWGPITAKMHSNINDVSALTACCACGGGTSPSGLTQAQINQQIAAQSVQASAVSSIASLAVVSVAVLANIL
jgi:hypothetical protein